MKVQWINLMESVKIELIYISSMLKLSLLPRPVTRDPYMHLSHSERLMQSDPEAEIGILYVM